MKSSVSFSFLFPFDTYIDELILANFVCCMLIDVVISKALQLYLSF